MIRAYLVLIAAFVTGRLAASEFEPIYLALFKCDPGGRPEPIYDVLDALFGDVDAYSPFPNPEETRWIDESELRARAAKALERLEEFESG